jgi:hypothetical protein
MVSYKRQLGWNEARAIVRDKPRKPVVTLLTLATAVATTGISMGLYLNAPSGFEGSGSMIMGIVVGFLGAPAALILCFIALFREKAYFWVNLISIIISLATVVWVFSRV